MVVEPQRWMPGHERTLGDTAGGPVAGLPGCCRRARFDTVAAVPTMSLQPDTSRRRRVARLLTVAGAAAVMAVVPFAGVAGAHTDLEYTVPAAEQEVAEPVTTITVAFGDPVTLVGAGFEVFTPAEETVRPEVFTEDDMVYVLTLPEPLAGGVVGVRYEVAAADGHILQDSFTFTVTAPPVTGAPVTSAPTVETTPPTVAPSTVVPPTVVSPTTGAVTTPQTAPAPGTIDPGTVAPTTASTGDADTGGGSGAGIVIGIIAAVVVGAAAFLVLRSRLGTPPS